MIILRQIEFSRKQKQRQNIAKSQSHTVTQTNRAINDVQRLNNHVSDLNKFNGDVDAWIQSYKDAGNYGEYKKLKSRYSNASEREQLLNTFNGQAATEQASVKKALDSANVSQKALGDQTHNYGKQRQSVRDASVGGNTFEAGGKQITVLEGSKGDVLANTTSGVHNGNATSQVLTQTNERRANDIKRIESRGQGAAAIPEANMNVGQNRNPGKTARAQRKQKRQQAITRDPVAQELNRGGVADNAIKVVSETPTKRVEAITTTTQGAPGTRPVNTLTEANVTTRPKVQVQQQNMKPTQQSNSWLNTQMGRVKRLYNGTSRYGRAGQVAAIGGTALAAAGATYGAYKHFKNKRDDNS